MQKEKVSIYSYGSYEESECPVLDKDGLEQFHTKTLLESRPKGISFHDKDDYVCFHLNYCDWAVKVSDYLDVMKNRPHVPNKKEAKIIRQEKAKSKKNR